MADDKVTASLQTIADLQHELAQRTAERDEALARETATAEVLQVINSSPGDLTPVFDAMLDKALHLCEAAFGALYTYDGELMHAVAVRGASSEHVEFLKRRPHRAGTGALGRIIRGEPIVHIADVTLDKGYNSGSALARAVVEFGKVRSLVEVPLCKEGALLGVIQIYRREVRGFSDKQIAVLQNFAAQAVIAMENARLITETREALEQQTATAEVLQVINSSPGDLSPVFDAMLEKATRLCEAAFGVLWTHEGDSFRAAALRGVPPAYAEFVLREPRRSRPGGALGRLVRGEPLVHIPDTSASGAQRDEMARTLVKLGDIRTLLAVPLRKDGALLGAFTLYRQEVRPFSDEQIALLQNFAAQAVIAMENARLITETREALQQQTATAEVLRVINSSPGDLAPVFDAILEKAHSLCGVTYGSLHIFDGERFRAAAVHNLPEQFASVLRQGFRGSDNPVSQRLLEGARFVHVPDLAKIDEPTAQAAVKFAGIRTALFLPLRRDDALLGMIVSARREIRPFTEKEIALLENFAARRSSRWRTRASSPRRARRWSSRPRPPRCCRSSIPHPANSRPFSMPSSKKAHSLCGITSGSLQLFDGESFHAVAVRGLPEVFAARLRQGYSPTPTLPNYALLKGEPFVQIADMAQIDDPLARSVVELGGTRTHIFVALRKDESLLGQIVAARQEVRLFSDKEIALLQNFAAQAVIAMENARLITETREALEQQTATAEVLGVINSSPGDLAPVFDAMLEKAAKLCEADTGVLWTYHGDQMVASAIRGATPQYEAFLRDGSKPLSRAPAHQRLQSGEPVVQIVDVPAYNGYHLGMQARELFDLGGIRTILMVPLRKEAAALGAFCIYRQEVRPFSEKQIALLQNFAAQAVIAIERAAARRIAAAH